MKFDFESIYRDKEILLADEYIRQIVHNEVFSITNMNEDELKESVIEDILMFTMWELQTSESLSFTFSDLVRFLPEDLHDIVKDALESDEVSQYLDMVIGEEIRIIKNKIILQEAMDYCGVWYSGFAIPKDVEIVSVIKDSEKPNPEVLALSLSMDQEANAPWSSTLN